MKFFDKFIKIAGRTLLRKKSVFFISLHKCATTLFNDYVLTDLIYHEKIDYESIVYHGIDCDIVFNEYGKVYGTIKIGKSSEPIYTKITSKIISDGFIDDKIAVILIRDPRDILVSEYYSFGFTHGLSDNNDIKKFQIERRNEIKNLSLDEYVIKNSNRINDDFMKIQIIYNKCKKAKIFKYENLVNDHKNFIHDLNTVLPMKKNAIRNLHLQSRPTITEDFNSHKRSGKVYGFVDKLSPDTINKVNKLLSRSLEEFQYPVSP